MNAVSRSIAIITVRLSMLLMAVVLYTVNGDALWAAPQRATSPADINPASPPYAQTLLVQFNEGTTDVARDQLIAEMGGELLTWLAPIRVAEIRIPNGDVPALTSQVAAGLITFAEENAVVSAAHVPNDPDFGDEMMSHGLHQVEALDAWDVVTGSHEIVVAVIDSGIALGHPEFAGRLVPGYDFINDDADAQDDSGHGTHVAGIIAAALDNDEGIAGICPQCRLMPVKVLNANNLGSWAQLAAGIIFAVDNGAQVLNLSLGASISSETLASAVDYAVQSGTIVVAAAGNYGSDQPFYPAALDGVIGVGATNIKGQRWAKSDFGKNIDLVAPGEIIYSTYHDMDNLYRGYTYMSGTSMAAPFVSGVAALLLSAAPTLSAADVQEAMIWGVEDLGTPGWDIDFGYGRINAMRALMAPVEGLVEAVGEIVEPNEKPAEEPEEKPEEKPAQEPVLMFLPVLNHP